MGKNSEGDARKGVRTVVSPIKSVRHIKAIKALLADNPRDLAIFVTGINTNLRASDLLNIRIGQVVEVEDAIPIRERKTRKSRDLILNQACMDAIQGYLKVRPKPKSPKEHLFIGQRGPLSVSTLGRMVKSWCKELRLKGNFASHTLRKTWGYHQRVTFGVDLPRLTLCFNHSSERETLRYLCIQPEEITEVFDNEL